MEWLSGKDFGLSQADFHRRVPEFVGKLSAKGQPRRPTQPSILPGSLNEL